MNITSATPATTWADFRDLKPLDMFEREPTEDDKRVIPPPATDHHYLKLGFAVTHDGKECNALYVNGTVTPVPIPEHERVRPYIRVTLQRKA